MQFYEMCTVPVDHTLGMYGVLAVVLFVFNASAQRWDTSMTLAYNGHANQNGITYRMADNKCTVCLAEQECAPFNPLQCEYYMDTNKIFEKENKSEANTKDPEIRSAIDTLVYSIIEEGKSEADEAECIPYVSKYTDCTKENICLGCKTCNCDKSGHWNCTFEATCRPELVSIIADKTVLETAMENLNKDSSRRKRSLYHSIRSIEEAHLENNINDDYHDKKIFNQYEATSNNEGPKDTNTLFEEIPNQDETDLTKKSHKKKGLIKLIVHSLIHDTLPAIFEDNNLDFENNRVKRGISTLKENKDLVITTVKSILQSVDFNTEDVKTPKNKITFDELSEWVNEVHPLGNVVESNYTHKKNTNDGNFTQETIVIPKAPVSQPKDKIITVSNPEYIAFEEVYSNIQVDNKTSVRRKPLLDILDEKDIDIYDDKYYDTITTSTLDSVLGNNILDGTDDRMTDQTKPSTYRDALNLQQPTELDIKNFELDTGEVINNSKINNVDASSTVNIMKRDVYATMNNGKESYSTNLYDNTTVPVNSSSISAMTISSIKNLRNGIFDPLDTLLENSQRDIKEILKLRDNLINFIRANREYLKLNISSEDLPVHLKNLALIAHDPNDTLSLRRTNLTTYDKYLMKLKRDVNEVIRDVLTLKKLYKDPKKKIVRKNIEEMTKKRLEGVMKKWQTDLNIISRSKRSNKGHAQISRRISNIIPKYLEGKVHPAMAKNKKDKNKIGHNTNILKSNHTVKNLTAAADISRRRDGKEKPFRGKVGQGLQVPLPPVTVPVFAGDYADWPAFEDLYSSVVHTRTDITPAYKMAQLMSRLHGEPHELLTHLAVSDSNYEVAWKILTDRYRNKRLIVDRLASPPAERNGRSIRAATWGKSSDHLPTYEDLKSFLEAESRRVDVQAGEALARRPLPLATRNGRVHRREEATVGNPGGTTPHWNQGVPTAGRQATGWQRVRSLLRSGFRGDGVWHSRGVGVFGAWGRIRCECPSSTNCRYCQGAHHPLLCMNRSGGAGAALDRISEGACPPRREQRSHPPRRSPPPHRSQGQAGDVNRRSPLTQGRGDNPHHGSRCRIGKSGTGTWPRTPIPGTGFNGRVSGEH
ncbi:hypothetical protein NE865_11968 [Phthorimaea operculella]|nr:hypothetical protein NE865_11968 [Phthorimaea operculella]